MRLLLLLLLLLLLRISAVKHVCNDVDIFRKIITSSKQILR